MHNLKTTTPIFINNYDELVPVHLLPTFSLNASILPTSAILFKTFFMLKLFPKPTPPEPSLGTSPFTTRKGLATCVWYSQVVTKEF